MKIIDVHNKMKALEAKQDEVPYRVICVFGPDAKNNLQIQPEYVCLLEDYVHIDVARSAVEWYVEQLGGKVKWED